MMKALSTTAGGKGGGSTGRPVRRRRPVKSRLGTNTNTDINTAKENDVDVNTRFATQVNNMVDSVSGFIATGKDGREITMDEYLKFASLSPWVPCPDPVARRCLDIAKAGEEDIHYELGSGDGRLNFHAIDVYGVKKSVGIDIDPSLIQQSNERIARRHPAPTNIQFICADLMGDRNTNADTEKLWDDIKRECTIMTMFFVEDALQKIKPILERNLLGSKCKVVTIGYEMKGWEPVWVEVILGLTLNLYDLSNLDQLFNRSERFDVSKLDEELNVISKKELAKMEKDEEGENPFGGEKLISLADPDDHDVDYHWDFDVDEVFDYDQNNSTRDTASDPPK